LIKPEDQTFKLAPAPLVPLNNNYTAFWATAIAWLVVMTAGLITRAATHKQREETPTSYPHDPAPQFSQDFLHDLLSMALVLIYFHLMLLALFTEREYRSYHLWRSLRPILAIVLWVLVSYGIFEPIRRAGVTKSNPDGKGYDMSGHYITLALASLGIQGELRHSPQLRPTNFLEAILTVIWIVLNITMVYFLYCGFITGWIYHHWYESLVGNLFGIGLGVLSYYGLDRMEQSWNYHVVGGPRRVVDAYTKRGNKGKPEIYEDEGNDQAIV